MIYLVNLNCYEFFNSMEWPMRQDEGDYTRDYPPTLLLGMPSNMMGQMHQSNNEAPSTSNGSNTMPPTVDQIGNMILPSVSGDSYRIAIN